MVSQSLQITLIPNIHPVSDMWRSPVTHLSRIFFSGGSNFSFPLPLEIQGTSEDAFGWRSQHLEDLNIVKYLTLTAQNNLTQNANDAEVEKA